MPKTNDAAEAAATEDAPAIPRPRPHARTATGAAIPAPPAVGGSRTFAEMEEMARAAAKRRTDA
jgi:hypothetical protein